MSRVPELREYVLVATGLITRLEEWRRNRRGAGYDTRLLEETIAYLEDVRKQLEAVLG